MNTTRNFILNNRKKEDPGDLIMNTDEGFNRMYSDIDIPDGEDAVLSNPVDNPDEYSDIDLPEKGNSFDLVSSDTDPESYSDISVPKRGNANELVNRTCSQDDYSELDLNMPISKASESYDDDMDNGSIDCIATGDEDETKAEQPSGHESDPIITAEFTAYSVPYDIGIFCGLADVLKLLENVPLDVYAMPEGSLFYAGEPVIRICGRYSDYSKYESAIAGCISQASGTASEFACLRIAAGEKPLYSSVSRLMHPKIKDIMERAAWVGGADASSLKVRGVPYIPLMTDSDIFGMRIKRPARKVAAETGEDYDYEEDPEPFVILCGAIGGEKRDVITAAKAGADAVLIDSGITGKEKIYDILDEVRWELNTSGYPDTKIIVRGEFSSEDIGVLSDKADAFEQTAAVGMPFIGFIPGIVHNGERPVSSRGRKGGVKEVYEFCDLTHNVILQSDLPPAGGRQMLRIFMKDGQILSEPDLFKSRVRVYEILKALSGYESYEE